MIIHKPLARRRLGQTQAVYSSIFYIDSNINASNKLSGNNFVPLSRPLYGMDLISMYFF